MCNIFIMLADLLCPMQAPVCFEQNANMLVMTV